MYSSARSIPGFLSRQLSLSTGGLDRATYSRRAQIASLNEQLATGKSVNRPSDDPTAFEVARAMDQALGRQEQYLRTINASRLWVDETESALSRIGDHMSTAYERALRAANATMSDDEREAIAQEIEGLVETIIGELNSKAGSEYIFAGAKTTTKPFEEDGSATSDTAGVTYYGDDAVRTRTIGDDLAVAINLTGEDVLVQSSGKTITESLNDLVIAVRSGDADALDTAIGDVTAARDHILGLVGASGGVSQRMSFAEEQIRQSMLHIESRRSFAEDADIATVLTDLQSHQLGLQAATQALLAIRQLDITNFL